MFTSETLVVPDTSYLVVVSVHTCVNATILDISTILLSFNMRYIATEIFESTFSLLDLG